MKKTQQRLWVATIVSVVAGACVIIALRVAMQVVITNNNLRQEELNISRDIAKQLAEIKVMIGRMPAGLQVQKAEDKKSPCGVDHPEGKPQIPPDLGSQKVEGVTPGTNQVKGNANAPVLMVEFSDFECPFSKRFYQETFPQIEKEYIATGKVKFAYRDFALPFHSQAIPAAIASRCAGRSGKYWEIFDKLSKAEKLGPDSISMCAKEAGMEKDEFSRCINDPAVNAEVKNDMDAALKYGVQGTPAFFINGRVVVGAMPFEAFKKVIDEELKKAKK